MPSTGCAQAEVVLSRLDEREHPDHSPRAGVGFGGTRPR